MILDDLNFKQRLMEEIYQIEQLNRSIMNQRPPRPPPPTLPPNREVNKNAPLVQQR